MRAVFGIVSLFVTLAVVVWLLSNGLKSAGIAPAKSDEEVVTPINQAEHAKSLIEGRSGQLK